MDTTFKLYALTAVVLFFKMGAVGVVQARARTAAGVFTNPEDARTFGKTEVAAEEAPAVRRAAKAFLNDLENIPIFLIIALVYTLMHCWQTGAVLYFGLFSVARISHTIMYLNAVQPWRTVSYAAGQLAAVLVALHVLIAIL